MEVTNETELAQGADLLTGMKTIETEEELAAYLGTTKDEPAAEYPKKPVEKAKEKDPNAIGEPVKEDEEEPLPGEGDDAPPVEFPTLLHYLNDRHKLDLNLEEVKELTKEQEAEALDSIIERMTTGVNTAIEEYQYIEKLMQDPEIREVLKAKSEGKSLKDLYAAFSSSSEGMNDDVLAALDFKKRFPKSSDEALQGMIDSLKKSNQFEPFVQGLREQHQEEQSLETQRAEQDAKVKAEQDAFQRQEELQRYSQYLGNVNSVYGVPLTKEMKEAVFEITTAYDNEGLTALDHALQSDEGMVLAALGIAFMRDMIQNGASIQKNRARGRVMDKIFDSPEQLQSGGGRKNQEENQYDPQVLDRF